jgi:hypothetical protein
MAAALDATLASHNCLSQHEEALDLSKELENPTEPGIHYRPTTLTSSLSTEDIHAELVCSSGVTSSPEDTPSPASEETASATETVPESESLSDTWDTLTKKWEVVATTLNCEDKNSKLVNPSCAEPMFLMEEGKMSSSDLDGSIASL